MAVFLIAVRDRSGALELFLGSREHGAADCSGLAPHLDRMMIYGDQSLGSLSPF